MPLTTMVIKSVKMYQLLIMIALSLWSHQFYFGGLPTGRFGKFNTGFNQQFISGSDTDLLLHFNSNLADSGRYNQTIASGGFPTFTTGVDDKYFGSAAIYFDGSDYLKHLESILLTGPETLPSSAGLAKRSHIR